MTLERTLSDLVNQAYGLTPAKIDLMCKAAPSRRPQNDCSPSNLKGRPSQSLAASYLGWMCQAVARDGYGLGPTI